MSNNKNLGDLEINKESEQQAADIDPTEAFDIYRKARQEMLDQVKDVLSRAAQGSKMDKKQVGKGLKALHQYSVMNDEIVTSLVRDLFKVIKAIAQTEVNVFAMRTNLKTLVRALERQDIINEEMMRQIHDEEVLPAELKSIGGTPQTEQILRKEDLQNVAKFTTDESKSDSQSQDSNQ